ncbi:MAG: RNA methyltransferase [Oscillospiraceae bacterium]|nr:RNA methyltransferase [Oscillospiraceae bacterium]
MKFISSKNNDFIIETAKLKQKKYRTEKNLFYVDGVKLLKEAMGSRYKSRIKSIIVEESIFNDTDIKDIVRKCENCEIIEVTGEVYKKITDEEAFQGVMCVIEKDKMQENIGINYNKPVIVLDSVRDPGNVGTIIRTAYAICDVDIILSEDCADIYSSKTQRAAMGAIFKQNIKICKNLYSEIENLKKNGYNIFATYLGKNSTSIEKVKLHSKTAVIFGNEGNGLCDNIVNLCDEKIIIPINQNSESLNVSAAAAIIMWEMRKQNK